MPAFQHVRSQLTEDKLAYMRDHLPCGPGSWMVTGRLTLYFRERCSLANFNTNSNTASLDAGSLNFTKLCICTKPWGPCHCWAVSGGSRTACHTKWTDADCCNVSGPICDYCQAGGVCTPESKADELPLALRQATWTSLMNDTQLAQP